MIIATAGHVDHGKTSLVRALTGIDTDRLPEEKSRGLTIDLGFAYTDNFGPRVGFVDVPGHQRFLPNMLAGVTGIDAALLVVAADDGVMPQTREHLEILTMLGVPQGIVVITKCDRVSDARRDEVRAALEEVCRNTVFANEIAIPVATPTGAGLDRLGARLRELAEHHRATPHAQLFRLAIDRVFTVAGAGTVITGMVHSGRCEVGDELRVSPGGQRVRVRGIRRLDIVAEHASQGDRAALNLSGVERSDLTRGDWVLDDTCGPPTNRFVVHLHQPAAAGLFPKWTHVHAHVAAGHEPARAALIDAQGDRRWLELRTRAPLLALRGDRCVIRDASATSTLCGGEVIDSYPPRHAHRGSATMSRLRALAIADHTQALVALLALLALEAPVLVEPVRAAWNLAHAEMTTVVERCAAQRVGSARGDYLLTKAHWRDMRTNAINVVRDWHAANPQVRGARIDQLHKPLSQHIAKELIAPALDECIAAGELRQSSGFIHLPDFAPALAREDQALWQRIAPLLANHDRPPVLHELTVALNMRRETLSAALARLSHIGLVVSVADNRFFLPERIMALATLAQAMGTTSANNTFTVREFRDRSGLGRNLAIEVLEYFDGRGFTRRDGDVRHIATGGMARLGFRGSDSSS